MSGINLETQHLFVVICEQCNLACGHCAQSSYIGAQGQIDFESLNYWLRDAAVLGLKSVDFSGGEPLLADRFSELIFNVLESTNLQVTIASNLGQVRSLDERLLKRNVHRLRWRIAMEGLKREDHDSIRAPGSFDTLWCGLEYLRKLGLFSMSCTTIVRPEVLSSLPAFVQLISKHGFNRHNWVCILPFGRGVHYRKWEIEPSLWFTELRPLALELSRSYNVSINLFGPIIQQVEHYCNKDYLLDENIFRAIVVGTDGDVYNNCFEDAFVSKRSIGNIQHDNFLYVESEARQNFKLWRCKRCRFRFACLGIKM